MMFVNVLERQHDGGLFVPNRSNAGQLFGNGEAQMKKKPDRRIERSQQLLRSALLSLIQEKGFEALTVQEIIDRANVGRATFYAHFENKEDLLLSGFEAFRASLKQRQAEALTRVGAGDERDPFGAGQRE